MKQGIGFVTILIFQLRGMFLSLKQRFEVYLFVWIKREKERGEKRMEGLSFTRKECKKSTQPQNTFLFFSGFFFFSLKMETALGGLLSAYQFSKDKALLDKAEDLGTRLLRFIFSLFFSLLFSSFFSLFSFFSLQIISLPTKKQGIQYRIQITNNNSQSQYRIWCICLLAPRKGSPF